MERKLIELYSPDDIVRLRRRRRTVTAIAAAAALVTLAVCVFFCARTTAKNAGRMLLCAVIASTLGGWVVITLVRFFIDEYKRGEKHVKAILEGEREPVDGKFTLTNERLSVIRGVSMLRIRVEGAPRVASLQLYDKKKKLFDGAKARRVYAVHGFAAAYETEGEGDEDN